MSKDTFLRATLKSFGYAFAGLRTFFITQRNARIHLFATVLVVFFGCYFGINRMEWIILLACIILVLAAEAFNTSIEFLTDLTSPEIHSIAKKVKDVAAAAVLICAIGAAIIGLLIFWPHVMS